MTDILMPALSPTMEEGTLSKWNIKVGDAVTSGQVIAEIETDKATMEVEAVDEGKVTAILVPAGTEGVKVNAVIAQLDGEEGGATASAAPPPANEPKPASEPKMDGKSGSDGQAPQSANGQKMDGSVQSPPEGGHGTPGSTMTPDGVKPSTQDAPKAAGGDAAAPAKSGGRIFASPLARRLAKQAGLDLSGIKGTGPHGRIVRADVEAAGQGAPAGKAAPQAAAPASVPAQVKSLEQLGVQPGSYDLTPLDNIRKVSARRLTEAFRDIPHFPLSIDCELDALLAARERINKALEADGVKVSVNDIVIKAVAMACKRVPEANASFTPEGIAVHHHADIAMAVAIPGGLITPVIRKAETLSLSEIAAQTKDLAKRAREKKLKPEEFMGGTFTVSNLGMFGIKGFSSIINEPGGCIMSVGAGLQQPVVRNGALAVATVMSITLTCDHRVVDGATGARFLQAFKPMIEDPAVMLA